MVCRLQTLQGETGSNCKKPEFGKQHRQPWTKRLALGGLAPDLVKLIIIEHAIITPNVFSLSRDCLDCLLIPNATPPIY